MNSKGIHTNKAFVLLWSGNVVSLTGFFGIRIAYPLLVLSVTGSVTLMGWAGFVITVPSLIFQIPAGIAADYSDRRRTLLICQLSGLTAACVAALVVVLDAPNPGPFLIVAAFVEGTAHVFFTLSELGAIRDIVDSEQRPAAFSFFQAEQPIGSVLGRALGAAAYGMARWLPFVIDAVSCLLCLATLTMIRGDFAARKPDGELPSGGRWSVAWEGVRIVWTEPFLRASTAISGLSNMVIQVVILLLIFEIGTSGRPVWTVGVVLGAAGIGGILGSFAAARLTTRFSAHAVYRGSLWAWTALLLLIAISSNPAIMAVSWCGIGGVGAVVNVALTLFRVRVIPEDTLGRTVGAGNIVTDGAVALGALLAGYVLTALGAATTGWVLVGAMLVLAICGSLVGRSREAPLAETPARVE
ncbi:MFS transporter [Nocardia sp. NBC_01009]|uniref:MFS transporter n=1 Tax=Nocardia sp. NBC_01009 TaxID=2975996 RepID=UPI003866DDC9|nr:MFS transporter [Nocardia sp. NBC_01009]